jgi:citrate synthase
LIAQRAIPPATVAMLREQCSRRDRSDGRPAQRRRHGVKLEPTTRSPSSPSFPRSSPRWRLGRGTEPLALCRPRHGEFFYMLGGEPPDAERVRALETYLNTVVDHG